MSHLRLDLIGSLEVLPDGLPGILHWAHLIPENPAGDYWLVMKPERPAQLQLNFLSFITALEDEFTKRQKHRRIDAAEKAILLRVEKNPLGEWGSSLDELAQLARTCGIEIFDSIVQYRPQPDPKFMVGKGKLTEISARATQIGANLIIFDHELTPAQVRSINDYTGLKVLDRTQVILDIFARRAHSREGKIQVELAQLKYLLPRLMHRDASLSRLAGGIGGVGPGEMKLEIERRRIRERIHRLEKDLKAITKSRQQRRGKREKTGLPVISIVGYTNAGKSTLLNQITRADVLVADQLFATLDPTTRRLELPGGHQGLLTDTVGFIQKLPTQLVAAFQATLEEISEADLLIHVVDITHPNAIEQAQSVTETLKDIHADHIPIVTALNKIDRLPEPEMANDLLTDFPQAVAISALKGIGINELLQAVEKELFESYSPVAVQIPYTEGQLISLFHEQGQVTVIEHKRRGVTIQGYIPNRLLARFAPYQNIPPDEPEEFDSELE